jgi:NH3-dependent NAD+ synthetase
MLLTTGNKSEMAVGYATLYGDMAGGFAPIKDCSKMLVYRLATYRNTISPVMRLSHFFSHLLTASLYLICANLFPQ